MALNNIKVQKMVGTTLEDWWNLSWEGEGESPWSVGQSNNYFTIGSNQSWARHHAMTLWRLQLQFKTLRWPKHIEELRQLCVGIVGTSGKFVEDAVRRALQWKLLNAGSFHASDFMDVQNFINTLDVKVGCSGLWAIYDKNQIWILSVIIIHRHGHGGLLQNGRYNTIEAYV